MDAEYNLLVVDDEPVTVGIDLHSKTGIRFCTGDEQRWREQSKREWDKYTFGCYGCRAATDLGEDMMFMGVPVSAMPTIVKGLTELAKKSIPDSRNKIYVPPIM